MGAWVRSLYISTALSHIAFYHMEAWRSKIGIMLAQLKQLVLNGLSFVHHERVTDTYDRTVTE